MPKPAARSRVRVVNGFRVLNLDGCSERVEVPADASARDRARIGAVNDAIARRFGLEVHEADTLPNALWVGDALLHRREVAALVCVLNQWLAGEEEWDLRYA